MEAFLGKKSHRNLVVDCIILALCIMFILAGISVTLTDIKAHDDGLWADFFLLALFLWPTLNISIKRYKGGRAKKYAFIISQNQDSVMNLSEIRQGLSVSTGKVVPESVIEKEITSYLAKGYLSGVSYDVAGRNIIIQIVRNTAPMGGRVVVCPNCGTSNTLINGDVYYAGQLLKCQACGTPLRG